MTFSARVVFQRKVRVSFFLCVRCVADFCDKFKNPQGGGRKEGRGYIKRPLRGAGAPGLAKEEEASKEEEEPTLNLAKLAVTPSSLSVPLTPTPPKPILWRREREKRRAKILLPFCERRSGKEGGAEEGEKKRFLAL